MPTKLLAVTSKSGRRSLLTYGCSESTVADNSTKRNHSRLAVSTKFKKRRLAHMRARGGIGLKRDREQRSQVGEGTEKEVVRGANRKGGNSDVQLRDKCGASPAQLMQPSSHLLSARLQAHSNESSNPECSGEQ